MKKWIVPIVIILTASAVCANEIRNGGFEQELTPGDWGSQWGSFSAEEWNDPPEGEWAGYIKGKWAAAGDTGGIIQRIQGERGAIYELTALFYIDGGWTAGKRAFKLEFFDADDNLLHAQVNALEDLKDSQWVKKRVLAKAPDSTAHVQVVFEAAEVGESGVLGIDDVKLTH